MDNKKVYVKVIASFSQDGEVRPMTVIWEDGRRFKIDKVTQIRRAYASKVGGTGVRYTVSIKGKSTFLFEDEGRWFVEAKVL